MKNQYTVRTFFSKQNLVSDKNLDSDLKCAIEREIKRRWQKQYVYKVYANCGGYIVGNEMIATKDYVIKTTKGLFRLNPIKAVGRLINIITDYETNRR